MYYIRMNAYAKINIGLDVINRRDDGYHNVSMIMQSVNLYDNLTISKNSSNKIIVRTNLPYLPTDKKNLVYSAAHLFKDVTGIKSGLLITLKKRIPVAAGLAGGSTDAAATLMGLNKLFNAGMTKDELSKLGVKLGADVPYCLMMGTALSEGIGDKLSPLPPMPKCHILLVKPNINVSTKFVYENLKLDDSTIHPNISLMQKAIESQNLLELTKHMGNLLETVTINHYPIINNIKDKMVELGAMTSLMSGSGPTVFGIFNNYKTAKDAFQYFRTSYQKYQVFLTKPYYPINHN